MSHREYAPAWIRIWCAAKRVQQGLSPPHWRYEVAGDLEGARALMGWTLEGELRPDNQRQRTDLGAVESRPRAWLEYYGRLVIDREGYATISLLPPPNGPPPT